MSVCMLALYESVRHSMQTHPYAVYSPAYEVHWLPDELEKTVNSEGALFLQGH